MDDCTLSELAYQHNLQCLVDATQVDDIPRITAFRENCVLYIDSLPDGDVKKQLWGEFTASVIVAIFDTPKPFLSR